MDNQFKSENLLVRHRINRFLQKTEDKSLVHVTADAGYGKTHAVLSYVSVVDAHIVWVSFTPLDNYTAQFWSDFCRSLDIVNHRLKLEIEKLGFPDDFGSIHQFIEIFTQEVHRDKPFILVFDDCHIISNSAVTNFLNNMISINIENLTIFLISRREMSFHKIYGHNMDSMCTITNEDLAFTMDEISEYFSQLNIVLSSHTVNEIYQRTEGWPIAVYLFALSVKSNSKNIDTLYNLENHLIFDIIDSEIFSKHSFAEQKILVKLSLFDFLPIRFMEVLIGDETKEMLESLFPDLLIRYNPHTRTYQFHQLFHEFLQEKLFLLSEQEIKETYKVAGEWFKKSNMYTAALNCYQKLEDYESLWSIISDFATQRVSSDLGEKIMKIIDRFPESFIEQNPLIRDVYGLSYDWTGRFAEATLEYEKIIQDLEQRKNDEYVKEAIGETNLLLGLHYMLEGDVSFRKFFEAAYQYLPQGSRLMGKRWLVINTGNAITLKNGSSHEMDNWVLTLEESSFYLEHVLNKSTYGLEFLAKAEAAYYQGNFSDAEKYAYQAIYHGKEEILVDIVCNSYFILSKTAIARGEYHRNLEFLKESMEYAKKYNTEPLYNTPEIAEGLYYTKIEIINRVPDWIINDRAYNTTDLVSFGIDRIIKANCLLFQEDFYELLPYLEETEKIYAASNQYIALTYVYIIKAIVYHNLENEEQLLSNFLLAYDRSYRNNIIMPFVEYGRYMRTLIYHIRNIKDHNIPDAWLDVIYSKAKTYAKRINCLRNQYDGAHSGSKGTNILSKQEISTLIAMSQGLTHEEIAENTNVSINTVKTQIKSIYSKLGAINGMHALSIAIAQGIILNRT